MEKIIKRLTYEGKQRCASTSHQLRLEKREKRKNSGDTKGGCFSLNILLGEFYAFQKDFMIILSRSTVENFLVIGKEKMEKKSFITREVCQLILIDSSLSIIYPRIFKFCAQSVTLEIVYFYCILYGLNFIRNFYFNQFVN